MGVKIAAARTNSTCFQWSQPTIPHSSSSLQALASALSSPSSRKSRSILCRYVHKIDPFCITNARCFNRRKSRTIRRVCSASLDAFSDEDFSKKIQELALRFQSSDDNNDTNSCNSEESAALRNRNEFDFDSLESPWVDIEREESNHWMERDVIPLSVEWKANSVEIPVSLRMIKRKLQWQEGFREAGESAYCSVKKAFSSMVFIIQELQSYTLQMRELLFTEDLQGVLVRVQKELHASFVWLFQQVFSHTPTLMVYVMILLANFTVYSMGSNAAIAASPPPAAYAATTESVSTMDSLEEKNQQFDSSSLKTFLVSSSSGKSTAIGGNGGGGGKVRPAPSGTEGGDGWFNQSNNFRTIVPDVASQLSSPGTSRETESVSGQDGREEELKLWNAFLDEARKMQALTRDESLDHETMQRFVSPIKVNVEADDYSDYLRTELLYQTGLSQDPHNPLLLANYAQFLCLVAQDFDRAEEYFKRAIAIEPSDAEAYSKYSNFLWRVRSDLCAAEETFLEAINADPTNKYYAGNYAHFLWNTGGEDTCFPLNSQEDNPQEL